MKNQLLLIFLIILTPIGTTSQDDEVLPNVPPGTISPPDPIFDEVALKGIDLQFRGEYAKALVLFDSLIQEFPDHPAPYFYKAATYQNFMGGYRFSHFQAQLDSCVEKVLELGKKSLVAEQDPWIHFYMGSAYGFRGFNRFRKHRWISAYQDAKRGIGSFRKAMALEPALYDVYLGLGSYYYWRTAKSKWIRILAFWLADKRELGLKQIEFSINHGRYSPNQASYVLVTSLIDAKRYDEAMAVLNKTLQRKSKLTVPDLYLKGYILIQFKNWPEVEIAFKDILQQIENFQYQSVGYQVECKYWIAEALYQQQQNELASQYALAAIQLDPKRNEDDELQGPLDSYSEIRKKLVELLQKLNL